MVVSRCALSATAGDRALHEAVPGFVGRRYHGVARVWPEFEGQVAEPTRSVFGVCSGTGHTTKEVAVASKKTARHTAIIIAALMGLSIGAPAAEAHTRQRTWRQRAHIEDRVRSQVGTRYSYGGSSPRGYDCSGLTTWTFDDHGANLPRSSMDQFNLGKRDRYRRVWKRKRLKVGDLVFHKTTSARVGHVGVYIGKGKFVSSTSSEGVRVRSLYDRYYWGPRWVGATRVPALMDRRS